MSVVLKAAVHFIILHQKKKEKKKKKNGSKVLLLPAHCTYGPLSCYPQTHVEQTDPLAGGAKPMTVVQ